VLALSALRAPIRHVATAVVALLVVACSLACAGCGSPSAASGSGSSAPEASIAQQAAQTEESADAATAPEAAERSARAQNRAREYENALEEKDFEVSSKEAALREVEEETGIGNLKIVKAMTTTWHCYLEHEEWALKPTYWYLMSTSEAIQPKPQTEEGITEIKLIGKEEIEGFLKNTFRSISEILGKELRQIVTK
jgi:hypothetical protein